MINLGRTNKIKHFPSGFTLVEILLALLLTSILIVGINAIYHQAHNFWARINETQPVYSQSRMVCDTFRQELSSLYLPKSQGGEEEQKSPVFLSVKSGNNILFLTMNPVWKNSVAISIPAKVTYSFKKSDDGGTLTRSEQLVSGEKVIGDQSQEQTVLMGISDFQIQVMDEDEWKSDCESKDKPPKAVKVQMVWPAGQNYDEVTFEMIVPILCSEVIEI